MSSGIDKIKQPILGLIHYFRDFPTGRKRSDHASSISGHIINEYNKTRKYHYNRSICYAPFKSLYFTPEGKIYACCYNRTKVLGTYPEQSITEIWKEASIQELRSVLRANDLTMGCFSCLTQMQEGTFSSVLARYFDDYPLRKYPSVMEFELSNVCNMACVMCDGRYSSLIRKEREKLPTIQNPYDAAFVHQLDLFIPHLSKAKFQGGEPFLINIYYDIWDKILKMNPGCVISVQTNGSVLNERIKTLMGRGNFHITVSVDATSHKIFEEIRLKGDFDKVMDNIQYFHTYCKHRNTWFGVVTCPMQQNWHEIPDIVEFCNALEAPVTFNRVWHPPHCALWNCSSVKLQEIHEFYSSIHLPEETPLKRQNKKQFMELTNQVLQWAKQQKQRETQQSEFAALDNKALAGELLIKIANHTEKFIPEKERTASIQYVRGKMEKIFSHYSGHHNFRAMLYKLHEIPVEVLYNEFKENTEEVLLVQAENYLREL